jgi:hypothetical protein
MHHEGKCGEKKTYVTDSRYTWGRNGQPRTTSEGGAQDNDHTWETKERSTRNYMRFSKGGSRNK